VPGDGRASRVGRAGLGTGVVTGNVMRRAVVMAGAAAASEGSACHLIRALCQ